MQGKKVPLGVKKASVKTDPVPNPPPKINTLLKYSGLGFQLVAVVLLGIWIGSKLDLYFEFEKPILTALLTLFFIVGFIVKLIKDFTS